MPSAAPVASYVPGPAPMYSQVPHESFSMPQVQSLTEGMPDPEAIEQQRRAYEKGLDTEFETTKRIAEEHLKQQKAALKAQAEQQLAMYKAQMEQALKQQEMSLDQHHQQAQMELQQAFMKQKAALEQQATSLTMEYQQRKMQEDLMVKQADMQREMAEMQKRMHQELAEHQNQQVRMQQEHAVSQAEFVKHQTSMQQDQLQRSVSQLPVYAAPGIATAHPAMPTMYAAGSMPTVVHQPVVYQAAGTQYGPPVGSYTPAPMSVAQAEAQPLMMEPQSAAGMTTLYPAEAQVSVGCGNCGEAFLPDSAFCRRCGAPRSQGDSAAAAPRYSYSPITAQYAQPMTIPAES